MKIAIQSMLIKLQGKDGLSPHVDTRWLVLACALLFGMASSAATPVETPYGAVSLPFPLHQVPGPLFITSKACRAFPTR